MRLVIAAASMRWWLPQVSLRTRGPSFHVLILARCLSYLKDCLFKPFPHFKLRSSIAYCWVVGVLYVPDTNLLSGRLKSPACCSRCYSFPSFLRLVIMALCGWTTLCLSIIHQWTLRLLLSLGAWEHCRNSRGRANTCWRLCFRSFGEIPRSGVIGSYANSIFNLVPYYFP